VRTTILRPLIDAAAGLVGLPLWIYRGQAYPPGIWLEGLIIHESSGDPGAIRYERHQDVSSTGDPDEPGEDDGLLEDDRSYGLLQIMGYNARNLCGIAPGTPMHFGFLLLPMTNMAFGLRILTAELRATLGDVPRALARYNGGPTGEFSINGQLRLQGCRRCCA
jgi:hypothetical protein